MATQDIEQWLERVAQHTWQPFSHIGKIRVDQVHGRQEIFVRSDWHLQAEGRPELCALGHLSVRRRAVPPPVRRRAPRPKEVLYPTNQALGKAGRRPVALSRVAALPAKAPGPAGVEAIPSTQAGGGMSCGCRKTGGLVRTQKVVFVDIAERPTFWMDTSGVVNGECLLAEGGRDPAKQALLWLALAVANSRFIEGVLRPPVHSTTLYAMRGCFITQYVEQFPPPDPSLPNSQALIRLAQALSQGPDEHRQA